MSRVAKNPIYVPKEVDVTINGQHVKVKGQKGSLELMVHPAVSLIVETEEGGSGTGTKVLKFSARNESIEANANAGTTRALLNNMVTGVHKGFERQLELVGVGYRVQIKNKILNLSLGFSHPVDYLLPEGVTADAPTNTQIILKGIDKQKVGQVAAEIRRFRPPEPYKGKGVRYLGEKVIIKETKKK